jgi:exopolysaccharide biosynthesis operon protein EpsL
MAILVTSPGRRCFRLRATAGSVLCLPALLAASGSAHALQGDRIRPSVGVVSNYYSNLFYVDDRIPADLVPFLKNGQKSDWSYGLKAGLDADIPVSRQVFTLRSNVTQNNFATYDNLDNTSYNARGVWNWVAGSSWDGDVGVQHSDSLGSFVDTRGNVKNLRKTDQYFASAMYRVYYDWKLRAALSYLELQNSDPRFRAGNRNDTTYELGSRYYSKGGDNYVGLNFRAIDGVFPNRQVFPGATVDNSYRQYTVETVVDWRYSPVTFLEGAVGWTNRLHEQISARNFSGITGRVVWGYGISGATSLNTTLFREIGALETVTSNYILTQGIRFGPSWRYSEKLTLQANAGFSNRQFLGDPLIVLGAPVRKDDVWTVSGSASWTPVYRAQVSGTVSYDTRTSNAILADYTAVTVFLSAQYTF